MTFLRRPFDALVLTTTALSLGLAAVPAMAQDASVTIPADRIGVVSFSFGSQLRDDPQGTLEALTACGIENIEFSGSIDNLRGVSVEQVATFSGELGFAVPSIGVGGDEVSGRTDEVIAAAKALGATYVRISGVDEVEGEADLDYYTRLAGVLNESGAAMAAEGITLAYHNHEGEFLADVGNGMSGYDLLLAEVEPENAVFELDTLWATVGGADPAALMEENPGRFPMLHVRDGVMLADADEPDADDTTVGQGEIDFEAIFAQSEVAGVEWYFIELGSPQPDGVTATCDSLEYLTATFTE